MAQTHAFASVLDIDLAFNIAFNKSVCQASLALSAKVTKTRVKKTIM